MGARQSHLTQDGRPANFPPRGGTAAARLVVAGATLAVVGLALRRSVRRIEVVGSSMAPALLPGDRLVVMAQPWAPGRWPRPGEVVAVRDPRRSDRILVKRVGGVDRSAGTFEVLGDAAGASTDSRIFGPVPRSALVGRAVYRYAPTARSGRGPWPEEYHLG